MKKKVWHSFLSLALIFQIVMSCGVSAFAEENTGVNTQQPTVNAQTLLGSSDITQYLSDLTWSSAKAGWESVTRDKDLEGNLIKLKSDESGTLQTYSKGLFAHAASQIDYDITDKGVKSFQSYIGINNMKAKGDCEFIVQVDGVEKFKSPVLSSNSIQQPVNIDIPAEAKTLTLITTTGGDDNDSDHSVWADAKIILDGAVQKNLKSIQIQSSKTVLPIGNTAQITTKGYLVDGTQATFDSGSFTFTSGDASVATVSNDGVVTGVGNGTVTITCDAKKDGITKSSSLSIAVGSEVEGKMWTVQSPDKSTSILFILDDNDSLQYSVQKQGKTVIGFSPVGINTSLGDFSNGLAYSSVTAAREINETYSIISHKKSKYVNHTWERTISFTKGGMKFDVIVRAYDDGIAFRYAIKSGDNSQQNMTISGESTGYQIPSGSTTWAMAYGSVGAWSYEDSFVERPIESVTGNQSVPLLYKTSDGIFTLLTEAELSGEYAGTMVKAEGNGLMRVSFTPQQGSTPVSTAAPFQSPWRVAVTGSLSDIVNNTMVENLSPAPDTAYKFDNWVQPGVTAWSWMSAGYSTTNQHDKNIILKYIDFAADMGWKYYIMDEGWQPGAPAGSDSNYAGYYDWFDEVKAHADAKGVKLIAWVRCDDLNTQAKRDARLNEWKTKGIAGIKVDFFDRETQDRTKLYTDIYKQCSDLGLIINTHGANKPAGEIRTYPNILTREAIRGQEQGDLKPDQFTIFPFTRNAIGPADVTETLYPCGSSTTVGLQVASSILVQSGLHCLASSPESYLNSPAYSLYKDLPSVWDETRLIDGYPGDFATMVRRSGADWYGASVTVNAKNATFPLDFLDDATTYYAMIYKDTGTTQNDLGFEYKVVKKGDVLTIPMKQGGGCAVKIVKNKPSAIETIKLDKTTASVEEGRFITLTSTITPEKPLIRNAMWTSSDNTVATVSSTGVVRGIKPGKVTITAASPADGTIKAVCAVDVTASAYKFDADTWNIRSADPDKIRFNSENSVTITMQQGEAGTAAGDGNYLKNIVATVPADQNFSVSVKVSGGLSKNYQSMALAAFTDEKNVVATMRRFHSSFSNNCFAMVRSEQGSMTETPAAGDSQSTDDAYLKLTKNGKNFSSYYSYDNQNWKPIRSEDAQSTLGTAEAKDIKIGVYASTGNSTDFKDVTFSDFTYYPNNATQGTIIPFAKANAASGKNYTVVFDSQGATTAANPSSVLVNEPQTTVQSLPTAPKKTGYTFGGWFTKAGGQGTEFKANTVVVGNVTVYAKWISLYKMNSDKWNIRSENSSNIRFDSTNSVTITMQQGEAGTAAGSGNYLKNIVATVPADQNFAISVKVSGGLSNDYQAMSLAAFTDETNVVAAMRRYHSSFGNNCFAMVRNEQGNGMTETPTAADSQSTKDAYLKLVKNGKTFTSYYSYDNQNWTVIRSEDAKGIIGTTEAKDIKIGVYASTGNSTQFKNVTFTDFTYYPNNATQGTKIPFVVLDAVTARAAEDAISSLGENPDNTAITNVVNAVRNLPADEKKGLSNSAIDKLEELLKNATNGSVTLTINPITADAGIDSTKKMSEAPVVSGLLLAAGITGEEANAAVTLNTKQAAATGSNVLTFELALNDGTKDIHELAVPVTVTFKFPSSFVYNSALTYKILHVKNDNSSEYLPLAILGVNGAYTGTFTTSSFSTFTVVETNNSGSNPGTVITTPTVTFVSDTTRDFSVNGTYQFKITSKDGKVPVFVIGTPGVFTYALVKTVGNDYYYKITAIGVPGLKAGIYVNGVKLLAAAVASAVSNVKCDTTYPFKVKAGEAYTFKITADAKPSFAAGTSSAFKVEFVKSVGKDYFFKVTAIGKAGAASGFYINSRKASVAVATVIK